MRLHLQRGPLIRAWERYEEDKYLPGHTHSILEGTIFTVTAAVISNYIWARNDIKNEATERILIPEKS
jgi:hypothetical protein